MLNEDSLIENIKQGERSSFDSLVELYRQKGLAVSYHMVGNLEDAKDVLQEAFVKVYLNIHGFQGRAQFSTWFYRIVVNCSLDFLRKKKRSGRVFSATFAQDNECQKEMEIPDRAPIPSQQAYFKELEKNLEEGVSRLSEKQKACFVLRHQNGLSIQEISEALKCNPATVKVHLFRAMEGLRKGMAKYLV